ncbi:MAG: PP2C family protein-serine/threonine phosphatase [Nostocoides sp.]
MLAILVVAVTAVGVAVMMWHPDWPAVAPFAPIVVVAGLFLTTGRLLVVDAYILWWMVAASDVGQSDAGFPVSLTAQVIVMGLMLWVSNARSRLGVTGVLGESMLVDLRDRLKRTGEIPALPEGWTAEAVVDSAHGDSFSGDFLIASRSIDGQILELALVDVSGKGVNAGTRSLLLSGALAGLLGSTPPEEFLPSANAFLLRQQWPEGFATCVHLWVDLSTGAYTVGSAGHPPAAHHRGGSGRWSMLDAAAGPLLGVVEFAHYRRVGGTMEPGDAILLYTDGVIESQRYELADGIDRMLGVAERAAVSAAPSRVARAVCDAARAGDADDRAAVVLTRT